MRSLLLVHAATDDFAAAMRTGADALVVALPDAADEQRLGSVRDALIASAEDEARPLVFVRLGGVEDPATDPLLRALMPAEPDGFVLSRCASGADVQHLGAKLAVHEAELDLADGQTAIIAEVGAVARTMLVLDGFVGCSPRLLALAWNPEAFTAELGLDAPGVGIAPLATARSLVIIAAKAAAIGAIDWATDAEGARRASARARRDGFNAKLAGTADQVAAINAAWAI